jgi:WD40 repeat protein
VTSLQGHDNTVLSVAFSPDGKYLASGSYDGKIKLWSIESQKEITTLQGHDNIVLSVAFSPDGKYLASGSATTQSSSGALKIFKKFKTHNQIVLNNQKI